MPPLSYFTSSSPSTRSSSPSSLSGPFALIRRPLPLAIILLVSLSLLYSFAELPLERITKTFSSSPFAPSSLGTSPSSEAHNLSPSSKPKKGKHEVVNGLMEINLSLSALKHPIYQLVEEAKVEWEEKLERQSKTLAQAVEEYKSRNGGRNPPKGFDKWWDYVLKNNVGLVDEYDMINRDINPYRGYSPKTLQHRMKQLQSHNGIPPEMLASVKDTFSLTIVNGTLTKHSFTFDPESIYGSADRAQGQFDLIKDVAQFIPDMTAVLSIQDTPSQFVSWSHLEELRKLTEEEEYWDEEDNEADQAFDGWGAACPPSSPLYKRSLEVSLAPIPHVHDPSIPIYNDEDPNNLDFSYPHIPGAYVPPKIDAEHLKHPPPAYRGKAKSFIASHRDVMDVCQHPDSVDLHGATAGLKPSPAKVLMPIFSLSKTKLHSDITVIPIEQWGEDAGALHWNEKEESRMLWRGRNTGMRYSNSTPWRSSHRARLAYQASYERNATIDILPPPRIIAEAMSLDIPPSASNFDLTRAREKVAAAEGHRKRMERRRESKRAPTPAAVIDRGWSLGDVVMGLDQGEVNERLFDVGLAFEAIQCIVEDGTCADIERELQFLPVKTFSEENHYRYILDIDGNAWSARMQRLLHSNAAIIKSSIFPEWWNDRVQPWVHYIPTKVDYEDLYDINSFFQGDGRPEFGENQMGRAIAEAGRKWSLENWRRVDMTAYMFRLYLEWARLLAHDKSKADFILPETVD